jgi:myosin-crossreactive antigen
MATRGEMLILDKVLKQVDQKFDEELSDVDFSQDELKKLKTFIHKGIESKSLEELSQNADLIIKNTQTLLDSYQDENTTCKADEEKIGNDNYEQINRDCYTSTLKDICPLYPFC